MTLVPLWVVLWRRWQSGAWTVLAAGRSQRGVDAAAGARARSGRTQPSFITDSVRASGRVWLAVGAVSVVACVWAALACTRRDRACSRSAAPRPQTSRAARSHREASRSGRSGASCPFPMTGAAAPHEFVAVTAGDERRRQLLGKYLPEPRWNVRVATFEGDVAERAEEWRVFVTEGRPGPSSRTHAARSAGRAPRSTRARRAFAPSARPGAGVRPRRGAAARRAKSPRVPRN